MKDILEKASRIRLLILDVDGVLTDGSLFIGDDGQEYKAFNSRDGHGIKMLQKHGVIVAIMGKLEKLPAYEELASKLGIPAEATAYVGDDVVDLPVMRKVGLAIAVQDAHPLVQAHSHWQTPSRGGRGAARDVCEMLMEAQGVLENELASYL
jgi:3-deoxy-D-manno-octulosonate 8-phosphate phosphatase (KDO 8-P phosphatase)